MVSIHTAIFHEVLAADVDLDTKHLDNPDLFQGIKGLPADDLPDAGIFEKCIAALRPGILHGHLTEGLLINIADIDAGKIVKLVSKHSGLTLVGAADLGPWFLPDPAGYCLRWSGILARADYCGTDDREDVIGFEEKRLYRPPNSSLLFTIHREPVKPIIDIGYGPGLDILLPEPAYCLLVGDHAHPGTSGICRTISLTLRCSQATLR